MPRCAFLSFLVRSDCRQPFIGPYAAAAAAAAAETAPAAGVGIGQFHAPM